MSPIDALVDWAAALTPQRLPAHARDAALRLVVDSLICGHAAAPLQRSQWAREFALEQAGPAEANIFGSDLKISALNAAAANAEMMNLLDADDTFLNGGHFGALLVAVALAEAQRLDADWSRVLLAIAAGFELNARIFVAPAVQQNLFPAGAIILGATLVVALLNAATRDEIASALGLAMKMAPTGVPLVVAAGEMGSLKYAPYATLARDAILAARQARQGYIGNAYFLDAEPGFLHAQGANTIDAGWLTRDLDSTWWIRQTSFKPYPSFRLGHAALDALKQIVDRDSIDADAIRQIVVFPDPRAALLPMHARVPTPVVADHRAPILTAMHWRHSLAMIALSIAPGARWSASATLADTRVWNLVDRIRLDAEPACSLAELFAPTEPTVNGRAYGNVARVVVNTARHSHCAEVRSCDGDPWDERAPNDWVWLQRKALNFLGESAFTSGWVDALRTYPGQAASACIAAALAGIANADPTTAVSRDNMPPTIEPKGDA